jgi:hypothetical protein
MKQSQVAPVATPSTDWAEAPIHKFCNDIAVGAFLTSMDDRTQIAG